MTTMEEDLMFPVYFVGINLAGWFFVWIVSRLIFFRTRPEGHDDRWERAAWFAILWPVHLVIGPIWIAFQIRKWWLKRCGLLPQDPP